MLGVFCDLEISCYVDENKYVNTFVCFVVVFCFSNIQPMRIQIAHLVLYLRQHWQDKRLQFSTATGNDPSVNLVEWNAVWLPDTFIVTQTKPSAVGERFVRIRSDGSVLYSQR